VPKHAYQYQSSQVNGEVKTVSQGTVSTQELQEYEQQQEALHRQREREQDLAQRQPSVHHALPLAGMIGAHGLSEDTQVLTAEGWQGIDEVDRGTRLATFNPATGAIAYSPAVQKFVYAYAGAMYQMASSCADHLVTPHHTMLYESYGTWKARRAEAFFVKGAHVPVSGVRLHDDFPLYKHDDELRFHVWCVTDGSVEYVRKTDGDVQYRFSFTKKRKIERLMQLLERLGYAYALRTDKGGVTRIRVPHIHPKFTKVLTEHHRQLSPRQVKIFLLQWSHTDGSYASSRTEHHFQLCTNVPFHRDLLQELAAVSGHKTTCATAEKDGYDNVYLLHIRLDTDRVRCDRMNKGTVEYTGRVWCPDVAPYHTVITRRNGKVFMSKTSNEKE